MDYYKLLHLQKEPFSNSPDPDTFFQSPQHQGCLQRLELSIRMRRGLNVVIGEVGTGKTTLCRQLLKKLSPDKKIECHLILDPAFTSTMEFLVSVATMLEGPLPESRHSELELKELIKQHLFRRGVDDDKIILLVIDEGQKVPGYCLEILREFLNYETNEHKLLQTVIFAQREFEPIIQLHKNFADRIALCLNLTAMNFMETRGMIQFRLDQASETGVSPAYFTPLALWVIYRSTKGFPRRVVNLCHQIMVSMLIQNRAQAGAVLAYLCAQKFLNRPQPNPRQLLRNGAIAAVLLVVILSTSGAGKRLANIFFTTAPLPAPCATVPSRLAPPPPPAADQYQQQPSRPKLEQRVQDKATEAAAFPSSQPVLGAIKASAGETMGEMIRRTYGPYSFTKSNLRRVMAVNPQLRHPSRLQIGDIVRFPAIPVRLTAAADEVFWVQVGATDKLAEAYRVLQTWAGEAPPLLIIASRDEKSADRFLLLLENFFQEKDSAQEVVARLPRSLSTDAKILPGLDRRRFYIR